MYLLTKWRWRRVLAQILLVITALASFAPCLSFRYEDDVGERFFSVIGLTEVSPLCVLVLIIPLAMLYLVAMPLKAGHKVLLYLPLMIIHGIALGISFNTMASWMADVGAHLLVGFGVYCGLAVLSNLATSMALYAEVELIEKG